NVAIPPIAFNQPITLPCLNSDVSSASWSPDGTQLVFSAAGFPDNEKGNASSTSQSIFVINVSDKTQRPLVNNGISAEYPAWSTDGKTIAYVSHDLYVINVDGTNRRNLTNAKFGYITNSGWSPDSLSIVFLASEPGQGKGVYVMDNSGAGLHRIYT